VGLCWADSLGHLTLHRFFPSSSSPYSDPARESSFFLIDRECTLPSGSEIVLKESVLSLSSVLRLFPLVFLTNLWRSARTRTLAGRVNKLVLRFDRADLARLERFERGLERTEKGLWSSDSTEWGLFSWTPLPNPLSPPPKLELDSIPLAPKLELDPTIEVDPMLEVDPSSSSSAASTSFTLIWNVGTWSSVQYHNTTQS